MSLLVSYVFCSFDQQEGDNNETSKNQCTNNDDYKSDCNKNRKISFETIINFQISLTWLCDAANLIEIDVACFVHRRSISTFLGF